MNYISDSHCFGQQELSSAKSKMTSVETRMSSELSARGQEISALQALMQTSYQEHINEKQQLNSKVTNHQPLTLSLSLCCVVCCQVIKCVVYVCFHRSKACKSSWRMDRMLSWPVCSKRTLFSEMPSIKPLARLKAGITHIPHSVTDDVSIFWVNPFCPSKDMNTNTNGDNVVCYKRTLIML